MTREPLTLAITWEAAKIRAGNEPVYLGYTMAMALNDIGLPIWRLLAAGKISIVSPCGIPAIDEAIFTDKDI